MANAAQPSTPATPPAIAPVPPAPQLSAPLAETSAHSSTPLTVMHWHWCNIIIITIDGGNVCLITCSELSRRVVRQKMMMMMKLHQVRHGRQDNHATNHMHW
jgi:hypothetical protein